MEQIDNFYLSQDEPIKSCLLALKEIILRQDAENTATWKYGMPMFLYKGKMFCYLWIHKKHKLPYIGMVEGKRLNHPELLIEKRSRMKIMLFDPQKDLPKTTIEAILETALNLYRSGEIKIKS